MKLLTASAKLEERAPEDLAEKRAEWNALRVPENAPALDPDNGRMCHSGAELMQNIPKKLTSSWCYKFLAEDTHVLDLMHFENVNCMKDWTLLFQTRGMVALGLGYAQGAWDVRPDLRSDLQKSDDALYEITRRIYGNLRALKRRAPFFVKAKWWYVGRKRGVDPSRRTRDRLAGIHYSLSSDVLYDSMLDPETKAYSCGIFDSHRIDLVEAQTKKVDYYLDAVMGLKRKTSQERNLYSVLDVGSGWGSIVNRIAERYPEILVTAITHSSVQAKEYHKSVDTIVDDMIQHEYGHQKYDCIIMMEVEHVGRNYYGALFTKFRRALKDDGILVLQSLNAPKTYDAFPDEFIDTYIFPGGYLPSITLLSQAAEIANLKLIYSCEWDRLHYEITFECWRRRFASNWHAIASALGTDAARAFRIYLTFTQFTLEQGGFAPHTMIFNKRWKNGFCNVYPEGLPHIPPVKVRAESLSQWLASSKENLV